ncbi:Transcription factor MYB98 [Tetrabaena socialis]|uniref:Transcription factor MYB98 n=1 Tax=Tetrabaena socialis TaxID=47790 RepID=A0A2J8AIH6_9CHLO|nr:Transcription factor MYB98 [Tetrabaena socialis]|eukprot:PNH12315.1 Transcription factor MYB98 [Tetrabaena socialis]
MSLEAERRRRYPLAKVKGGWSPAEDAILKRLVEEHGQGNWSVIARHLNATTGTPSESGRIGKQCRERFNHHLRPDIKKDAWTEEEEELLVAAHLRFGNRWSDIARHIQGRTENSVKNHWNATLRRKDGDRCGGRSGPPPQSCVLRDYMVRIALLACPEHGSPARAGRAEPPAAPLAVVLTAGGPASLLADAALPEASSKRGLSDGGEEAAAPVGLGGTEQQRTCGTVAGAEAGPASSPCSSTSTQAGLGLHSGGRDVEGPAASASAEQEAAQAPERKRPRIITFAAAPASPLHPQQPRSLHAAEPGSRQQRQRTLTAKAALRSQEPGPRPQPHPHNRLRQQQRPYQHPQLGGASDSAEESLYGSPVSERLGWLAAYDAGGEAAKADPYGMEQASSSEVQAAQIMLALRSLTGC